LQLQAPVQLFASTTQPILVHR
jgi:hypothetical protein